MKWNEFFKKTVVLAAIVLGCVLLLSTEGYSQSTPQAACSLATLKGNYGFRSSGFNTENPGEFFPTASVAMFTYDGAGNVSGIVYFKAPPGFLKVTTKGTYKVNPNCTGSITQKVIEFPDRPPGHIALVIVHGGDEYFAVSKDTGPVSSAIGKRQ